jgi:hypothetical protein
MQQSLQALETALRILKALTEHRHPEPADVEELQQYAGSRPEGMDLDEFVCQVIQTAIQRRAIARARQEAAANFLVAREDT